MGLMPQLQRRVSTAIRVEHSAETLYLLQRAALARSVWIEDQVETSPRAAVSSPEHSVVFSPEDFKEQYESSQSWVTSGTVTQRAKLWPVHINCFSLHCH
jgi:hypothetical protein